MVKALASQRGGPDSISRLGVICGLSLLLVLVLALRGFFSEFFGPSPLKTNIFKFQFDLGRVPDKHSLLNTFDT